MADFVTLTCPSCSGKLQINQELQRFACSYCGTEFVVNRGGGVVSLAPVVEGLKRVEKGVDRTASELAIARLTKDISDIEDGLASIEVIRTKTKLKRISWVLPGGIFLVLGSVMFLADSRVFGIAVFIVVASLAVLVYGLSGFAMQSMLSEEQQLQRMLANKQAELSRHMKIVQS